MSLLEGWYEVAIVMRLLLLIMMMRLIPRLS